MKKPTLLVLMLLLAITAHAKWPAVNSTVPGNDGDCLINSSGNVGASTCGAGGGAPTNATYITQTPNSSLSAEQALSLLATGLLFNTTGTGVLTTKAPTDDNILIGNGSDWQLKAFTDCQGVGKAVTYTAATNSLGCNTITGSATTFTALTDVPSSYTGQALKIARVNAGETALEFAALTGGGDALKADPLSQFAATTSTQLAGVLTDETGSAGGFVRATSPTIVTPIVVQQYGSTSSGGADTLNNPATTFSHYSSTSNSNKGSTHIGDGNTGEIHIGQDVSCVGDGIVSGFGPYAYICATRNVNDVTGPIFDNPSLGNAAVNRVYINVGSGADASGLGLNMRGKNFVTSGASVQGAAEVVCGHNCSQMSFRNAATTGTPPWIWYEGTDVQFARLDSDNGFILPASKYFNFGSTRGSGGYGVRDNAGTMETKNSGGSWTGIGTGGSGLPGGNLFSAITSATVTATSATTLIGTLAAGGSLTVPVNTFTAGSVMEFIATGYYSTPATPVNLTLELFLGGSARLTTGAVTLLASVTNGTWKLACPITTRTVGSSGTQIGNCIFEATGATLTPGEAPMQVSSAWTIATDGTIAVDFKATWSTATGSPTITASNVAAWIPGAPVTSVNGLTGAVTITSGSSLTYTNGTDANTTMAVNTGYRVSGTALTADRTYTLPANCTEGDSVAVIMTSSNTGTNELILTANTGDTLNGIAGGTEWSRLFMLNERVVMRCITTNTTWLVEVDGRIPQQAKMILTTSAAAESAATFMRPTTKSGVWTKEFDNGTIASITNDTMTVRRAGRYNVLVSGYPGAAVTAGQGFSVIFDINASGSYVASGQMDPGGNDSLTVVGTDIATLAVGDVVTYYYSSSQGSRGLLALASPRAYSKFQVVEQLQP